MSRMTFQPSNVTHPLNKITTNPTPVVVLTTNYYYCLRHGLCPCCCLLPPADGRGTTHALLTSIYV
jgi:hypothetical protein